MIFKQKCLKLSLLPCLNPANNADTPWAHSKHRIDTPLTADSEFLDYSLQSLFRILEQSIWFIEHWSRPEWRR